MTPEQWEQVRLLFERVMGLEPSQESAYLNHNCPDKEVRKAVKSLLDSYQKSNQYSTTDQTRTSLSGIMPDIEFDTDKYFNNLIGKKLNKIYLVEEKVGQGGMGAVFRCTHLLLGNQVAIKVMLPEIGRACNDIKRFRREARVGYLLSHPNIIKVFEFSQTDDGTLFMVMEFIKGETLRTYINQSAPFSLSRCLEIIKPLCDALDTAHKRNILHRDLKPSNILISEQNGNEVIKLADFGIVKLLEADNHLTTGEGTALTTTGKIIGSLDYMSPEQMMDYKLTPASDIYSLGVILHEMLTATLPIHAFNLQELIKLKMSYDKLPPPSIEFPFLTPALDKILRVALTPAPQNRYQKAIDLFSALNNAL